MTDSPALGACGCKGSTHTHATPRHAMQPPVLRWPIHAGGHIPYHAQQGRRIELLQGLLLPHLTTKRAELCSCQAALNRSSRAANQPTGAQHGVLRDPAEQARAHAAAHAASGPSSLSRARSRHRLVHRLVHWQHKAYDCPPDVPRSSSATYSSRSQRRARPRRGGVKDGAAALTGATLRRPPAGC